MGWGLEVPHEVKSDEGGASLGLVWLKAGHVARLWVQVTFYGAGGQRFVGAQWTLGWRRCCRRPCSRATVHKPVTNLQHEFRA